MALPNIFNQEVSNTLLDRIMKLTPETQALWGKMDVAQMLAHCNVTYELTFDNIHPKPNAFMRFITKTFLKNLIVGEKPYKKNSPTAPVFKKVNEENFGKEQQRLIDYLNKTVTLGAAEFEGRENPSFGKLTSTEWNNLFYKHLNHHLEQFGV